MVAAFSLPDQEEQLRLREHARSDVGWLQLRYKLAARRVPMLLHVANQSWMGQFALCTFGCTLGELSTWRFPLWIALWSSFLHFGRGASAAGLGRGWRLGCFSTHPLKPRVLVAFVRMLAPSARPASSAQAGPCAAAREGVSLAGFYITHACATEAR